MKNLKWKIVPVRMTTTQYENLMRAAEKNPRYKLKSGRINVSEFIRTRIFSFQKNPDEVEKKIDGLIFQMRKIEEPTLTKLRKRSTAISERQMIFLF